MTDQEALDELARLDAVSSPSAAQKARIVALELRLEQPVTDADRLRAASMADDPALAAEGASAPVYNVTTGSRGTRNPWPLYAIGIAIAWWKLSRKR